jgi:hypothetical protein
MATAFVVGGTASAQSNNLKRAQAELAAESEQYLPMVVAKNQYGDSVGILPLVSPLPSVSLPAMPVDAVRPPRPVAPQAPSAARQPQAPPAPASPQAPKPPVETAAKASAPPKNYPRGEVLNDQVKRLYLAGRPVGEIRARKGRLSGEIVDVKYDKLQIDIWPGNYFSRIALPVDRGQYKIAFATGKGWVFLPEKTNKVPAGCESVQIGD